MADARARFTVEARDRASRVLGTIDDRVTRLNRSFRVTQSLGGGLFGGLLAGAGLSRLSGTIDEFNSLQTRVRGLSDDQESFNENFAELGEIARDVGQPLRATVDLFGRATIAAQDLGATEQQILDLTSNFQKLGAIGGSSVEQLSNASLQFGQGLGEATFRTEEWNSLLSNTPLIATRIAEGLGKSTAELGSLIRQGGVASRRIFESLVGQTEQINAEFEQLPLSVGRTGTELRTSFQAGLAAVDETLGITEAVALTFDTWSNAIDEATTSLNIFNNNAEEAEGLVTQVGKGLGIALGEAIEGGNTPFEARQESIARLTESIQALENAGDNPQLLQRLRENLAAISEDVESLRGQATPLVIDIGGGTEQQRPGIAPIRDVGQQATAADQRAKSIERIVDQLRDEEAQLGFNTERQLEYNLAKLGANQNTIEIATALQREITAYRDNVDALDAAIAANDEYEQQQTELAEALRRTLDPTIELTEDVRELSTLFREGRISAAELSAGVTQLREAFDQANQQADQTRSFGEEFGLTFSSVFEDAIVAGSDFRDVLSGIEADLLRIVARRLITEPFGNAATNLIDSLNFGNLIPGFANGGSFTVGGSGGTDSQLIAVTPGEHVDITPAGQSRGGVSQTINFNFPQADIGSFQRNADQFARVAREALQRQ